MYSQEVKWLLEEKYRGEKTAGFFTDVAKLEAGKPLAYIIGHIPFLNCTIYLDSHPLIPRPETEFWVAEVIKEISRSTQISLKVLDLCAGSGCIGVAVAKATPKAFVDFIELEVEHVETIKKNCQNSQLDKSKLNIWQGNLFAVQEIDTVGKYDFILTNPPYIDPEVDRTENSVKGFEPHVALYGGVAGMEVIARIISEATKYLNPAGQLWIEHEPEQVAAIESLALGKYTFTSHKDQYGLVRFSKLVLQ
jgi:release factor glutamine methyltransferase